MFSVFIGGGGNTGVGREKGEQVTLSFFFFSQTGSTVTLRAGSPEGTHLKRVCNSIQACPAEFQNEKAFVPFDNMHWNQV